MKATKYNTDSTSSPDYGVESGPSIPLRALRRSRGSLRQLQEQSRSTAGTLGERINEDIFHGHYECSICVQPLLWVSSVWFCRKCWSIYHFDCLKKWSTERPSWTFTCPSCRETYPRPPHSSCWCGRRSGLRFIDPLHAKKLDYNTCGAKCPILTPCGQTCPRKCHAGPCPPCERGDMCPVEACRDGPLNGPDLPLQVPLPTASHAPPRSALQSVSEQDSVAREVAPSIAGQRVQDQLEERAPRRFYILSLLFFVGNPVLGALVHLLYLIITRPYHYRSIAERNSSVIALIIFIWAAGLAQCFANFFFWRASHNVASRCLEVSDVRGWGRHPGSHMSGLKQMCSWVIRKLLAACGVLLFGIFVVGPIISATIAPLASREAEFSSVCNNFDTRVDLDKSTAKPLETIRFKGPDLNELAMKHVFQYSSQLQRNVATLVFDSVGIIPAFSVSGLPFDAIAYDFGNGRWSSSLNGTTQRSGRLIHTKSDLILPELGLQIPNFSDFERNCVYEPYVKVHRGSGDAAELDRQRKEKFTHDDEGIVLRTAAFGWMQGKLDMCAQRRSTVGKEDGVVVGRHGLGDDLPVVAGLIASLRYHGFKKGTRKLCGEWGTQTSK